MSSSLRVALGSDTVHEVSDAVAAHLEGHGAAVLRCGGVEGPPAAWPVVAEQVARLVASGAADVGVVCCWTGTGVSIAANKVPGVRAALCADPGVARDARRWNGANVLALALATLDPGAACAVVDAFVGTSDIDPEEAGNIAAVSRLERRYARAPEVAR